VREVPEAPDAFDVATAVRPSGDGHYAVDLDETYSVLGMPNGGYLLALAARAAGVELTGGDGPLPHCLAASVAYARAMACGPAEVRVEVDRRGARVSQAHAEIAQDGRVAVRALLSMGKLRDQPDVRVKGSDPVELPDPGSCTPVASGGPPGSGISIMDRVELRLDPKTAWFDAPGPGEEPEIRGWIRLADGRRTDPLGMLFLADALPPSTFPIGSTGWVPTIQLSVYVRALAAEGWLRARQYARSVTGGLLDQGCELWDANGTLVASSTQLAMVRFG
jgi:acyl-CoA thioesterase